METYTFDKNFLVKEVYWVTGALSQVKDEPKKFKTHLLIKDGKLTCTDGSRLHHIDLDGFGVDGLYRILKRTKAKIIMQQIEGDDWDYPDFDDLLEGAEGSTMIDLPFYDDAEVSSAYALIIRAMGEGTLQYRFVADVLAWDEGFTAHVGGGEDRVVFETEKMIAVVMPQKI